ncbi:DUF7002 family protein [Occultella gossypii]|uniref:Uncharacterized protein n=1 Tax=Occultella gossypii TaxID=2800820 RepID=A0ABS7S8A1_9MICO|nr:hypothetical protein [Occultella gossypii]MBZ2195413.1 hypothetical protein [Occultella gossypii]
MERSDFIAKYPRLFHTAADGSWPSIREHGLLSTRALLDRYRPPVHVRAEILDSVRRTSHVLTRAGFPEATVRDQRPLKFLSVCLEPGVSEQDYLNALNARVFFHVNESDLQRLLRARMYRTHPQHVLTLDTAIFLESHPAVELAPYNTGSIHVPNMPKRGPSIFTPLEQYPWEAWRRKRGKDAVRELTVCGQADVAPSVVNVARWHQGTLVETILP